MKKSYTPEEKKAYFQNFRLNWVKAKELAETDKYKGIIAEVQRQGITTSVYSIVYAAMQMEEAGFDGLPHVDCKTFALWKKSGFAVKKGEISRVKGVSWVNVSDEGDTEKKVLPKGYALFHRSQVEPIQ